MTTKLKLNREFAIRHIGVALLMFGLSCYFGYDGFVGYPSTPAADLYRSIEGSDAPAGFDLAAFKRQKIQSQYGFMALTLLAALIIGGHVWAISRLRFSFDDEGFTCGKRRFAYSDITSVDRSKWATKTIIKVNGITLDAWHHEGVKAFVERLERLRPPGAETKSKEGDA